MNFFKNINKSDSTAMLVENGLVSAQVISRKEILDCVFIGADVMRET